TPLPSFPTRRSSDLQRAFFTASDIRSGIVAHFPAAFDVLDATTTQLRVRRMLADVFAMVPAAHAFGVCRGTDLYLQSGNSSIGRSEEHTSELQSREN